MPINPTYPGVYIEEIPSGVRPIIGVATSITAFVGRTATGPVDEPVTVNSYADFERVFGGLWKDSTLGFAVRDFFRNGGSQAVVVRLYRQAYADKPNPQNPDPAQAAEDDAAPQIDAVVAAGDTAAQAQNATIEDVLAAVQGAVAAMTGPAARAAGAVLLGKAQAAHGANGATPAKVAQAVTDAEPEAVTAAKGVIRETATLSVDTLNLVAAHKGAWGNTLRARVDHDVSDEAAAHLGVAANALFNLSIRDMATGLTEVYRNVSVLPGPTNVRSALEAGPSRLARVTGNLPNARPAASPQPAAGKTVWSDPQASSAVAATGTAGDGENLVAGSFTGDGTEAQHKGLYALDKVDLFNLLCIPPLTQGATVAKELLDKAIAYCVKRRAFLIIDSPAGWTTVEAARDGLDDVSEASDHAAIFFPRLLQPNPLRENQMEEFAACGAVAGIFARTDASRGVWKAPAGLDAVLNGVQKLTVKLSDAENGMLNPLGINCLRNMPPAGHVVWGARTRRGADRLASEWKYIPIRRLALFIEESLFRGTQWVVFEPNDEPLWASIRLNVGAFMNTLFRQGAFQGSSPRDAYFVKCDRDTNPQPDIDRGVVTIQVGFAPLKPAEFVIIQIQQMAGQTAV